MAMQETDNMFDRAARQFNSCIKTLDEDVVRLQEWLETQLHLPKLLDEHALRNFLILNKCSIEIAKQKIDSYYSIRAHFKEIFCEMNPKLPYHRAYNDMVYWIEHPQLTDEMHKLSFFKVKGETVSENYDPINFIKKNLTMQELRLRNDVMYGEIIVIDCKGFPLHILLRITPTLIYKTFVLYERVLSSRFKAVHLINVTPAVMKIVRITKGLIKPKLSERIHVHSNEDALKNIIPLNLLPVDFGGEGLSLRELEEILEAKYAKNHELFDRLDKIKVDENLRPEKMVDDDTLGFYGSFKKLDID